MLHSRNTDLSNLRGVVLWENENISASFAAQVVTLSESLENFSYYEIEYVLQSGIQHYISTGKIPVGKSALLQLSFHMNGYRTFNSSGMSFGNCTTFLTYGNSTGTTNNAYLVPAKIIAYK